MTPARIWDSHGLPKLKQQFFQAVVDDQQLASIDGFRVDSFSASAVCSVLKAIESPAIKEKFLALPVDRIVHKSFTLIERLRARRGS